MIKSYIRIAWRNIVRHKIHTGINVIGLALGITCCLFIFFWVRDERSVDNFHANGKNLYTVYQTLTAGGKAYGTYSPPTQFTNGARVFLLEDLQQAVPEVKRQTSYATGYELPWGHAETIRVGEKVLKLEGSRAGEDFFTLFSYPLLAGSPATALKGKSSITISRKMAELFFGSPAKAMGQTVRYENQLDFVVTSVFENLPEQSSLKFDFLLNWEMQKGKLEWSSNEFRTYIQLSETADVKKVEAKINRFLEGRLDTTGGFKTKVGLQRFGDQYLYGNFVNGQPSGGRIEYVRIFSGVALFILLIACINFMNLATARSVQRAKEIGLRKVVGSTRAHLILQFLGEALLFSMLATLLSLVLVSLLLPAFNRFTDKHISLPVAQLSFWFSLTGLMVLTGLLAGSYPALYLSSLQPIRIIKGVVRFTRGATWFRKGLTVFQFVLSIVLIISTIVILRQTNYVQTVHLGYDRENLIYIRIEGELSKPDKYLLFKNRAASMPGIALVDRSSEAPHAMNFVVVDAIDWEGKEKNAVVGFKPSSVGLDFIKLMKMDITEGRDFSRLYPTDTSDAFMVNEEAVRRMGLKHPIGKWVSAWKKKGHIVAILKDYHTQSLHDPILPVIIDVKEDLYFGVIIVRTQPGKTKEALASLATVSKDINPGYPFAYQFVDEEYKKLYNSEQVISRLTVVFATLAILISCLGLLGLVMFAAQQRTKEIGIRKVLGASISSLIGLFSLDFLGLITLAFLIAAPLAWYFMHGWLQDFAYRVSLSWWIFVLAGAVSVIIALLTVSYQALKAAMANPVQSLKTD